MFYIYLFFIKCFEGFFSLLNCSPILNACTMSLGRSQLCVRSTQLYIIIVGHHKFVVVYVIILITGKYMLTGYKKKTLAEWYTWFRSSAINNMGLTGLLINSRVFGCLFPAFCIFNMHISCHLAMIMAVNNRSKTQRVQPMAEHLSV